MWQTLSGCLAAHGGGWTDCEAGCQHEPSHRALKTIHQDIRTKKRGVFIFIFYFFKAERDRSYIEQTRSKKNLGLLLQNILV